jgi:hypothetical protein
MIQTTGRIIITADSITLEGFEPGNVTGGNFSCRTFAIECIAWGLKRVSDELAKSAGFYATGEALDNIIVDAGPDAEPDQL